MKTLGLQTSPHLFASPSSTGEAVSLHWSKGCALSKEFDWVSFCEKHGAETDSEWCCWVIEDPQMGRSLVQVSILCERYFGFSKESIAFTEGIEGVSIDEKLVARAMDGILSWEFEIQLQEGVMSVITCRHTLDLFYKGLKCGGDDAY